MLEPAFQPGWRFIWGHRQITIWVLGLPTVLFSSLILDVPVPRVIQQIMFQQNSRVAGVRSPLRVGQTIT
jgi:hypothetical protein